MEKGISSRYHLLDTIRGAVLISMICYHGAWNLVNLYGVRWRWYAGTGAHIWQQSICWTFIFLSGFCWSFGKKHLKRGLMVFGGGVLVSVVTLLVMPENRVLFGVLTLIGSCMLLMILLDKVCRKIPAEFGAVVSALLFVLTRNINDGYLGFERWNLVELPREWYHGVAATYVGFVPDEFYSTDYFSLIPWIFLFLTGYFVCLICKRRKWLEKEIFKKQIPVLDFIGRHSLIIYLLHQPVLYGVGELLVMCGIL